MANANAGAIHALGYPLTAHYGIPHGLANALVAAAALERIEPGRPERCAELAALLGEPLPSRGLNATKSHPEGESREPEGSGRGRRGSSPRPPKIAEQVRQFLSVLRVDDRLSSWGVPAKDLPELADAAVCFRPVLDNTPVDLSRDDLLAVYRAAA